MYICLRTHFLKTKQKMKKRNSICNMFGVAIMTSVYCCYSKSAHLFYAFCLPYAIKTCVFHIENMNNFDEDYYTASQQICLSLFQHFNIHLSESNISSVLCVLCAFFYSFYDYCYFHCDKYLSYSDYKRLHT